MIKLVDIITDIANQFQTLYVNLYLKLQILQFIKKSKRKIHKEEK